MAHAQVYVPRPLQLWRAVVNWLEFFLQIFRGTPSLPQLLSYVGLPHPLLSSSASSVRPLPIVELPLHESSPEPPSASLSSPLAVEDGPFGDGVGGNGDGGDDGPLEKLTVVLDLDETLVCAYETSSLSAILRTQATEAGLKWFELEFGNPDMECKNVTVFERPGLQEFLKQTSEFAELVLFTAGLEGYAGPLVDRIDVAKRFSKRLYRPSTVSTKYLENVKDLSCLSKDLRRVVIVDDIPLSFLLQPLNGIPCIPFSPGQPNDHQLLEVILPLLKQLSLKKDVRPILNEKFHMPDWFQLHGIPVQI